MERNALKTILKQYYSADMVKSILIGRARPSYKRIVELYEIYEIPFLAWKDIRLYITDEKNKEPSESVQLIVGNVVENSDEKIPR